MNLYNFIYIKVYKKLPLSVRVLARDIYFILKYGSRDMFVTVGLDLNTKCNLKCKYCPNHYLGGKGDHYMTDELLHKVISELVGIDYHGNVSVPALYAEPLLDDGLVSKLSYIRERLPRARIIVFTNGTRLTVSKYLELVGAGVNQIIVTGHNELGRNNISRLKEFLKVENEGIPQESKILGALGQSPMCIEYVNLDMNNLTNRAGNVPLVNVKLLESCVDPGRYLYVTYSGKILFCCNDYLEENVMGDLKTDSLMSIWRDEGYKRLRHDVKHGILTPRMCRVCGYGGLSRRSLQ